MEKVRIRKRKWERKKKNEEVRTRSWKRKKGKLRNKEEKMREKEKGEKGNKK
jgi:hypothetical protein